MYAPIRSSRVVSDTKWRVISLLAMGTSFVLVLIATISTNWREDQEDRYDVLITHGLWRICRDIKFGSTFDHKCSAQYASDGPDWLQTVRVFMVMSTVSAFLGFAYSVYLIATMPEIKKTPYPTNDISFNWSGLIFLFSTVCVFIGAAVYSVATAMDQALYFPENLPPTWGNSWAQVLARRNSMPSDIRDAAQMKMSYGYSFGFAWFSVVSMCTTFILNFFVSV